MRYKMFGFGKNNNRNYSTVTVNGKTIRVRGNNITIINDKIIVDGKPLEEALDHKNITVIVEGNCTKVDTSCDVEVKGDCGTVDCGGSCTVGGNVQGDIDCGGSVTCGDVGGDIDCGGSVRCTRN